MSKGRLKSVPARIRKISIISSASTKKPSGERITRKTSVRDAKALAIPSGMPGMGSSATGSTVYGRGLVRINQFQPTASLAIGVLGAAELMVRNIDACLDDSKACRL